MMMRGAEQRKNLWKAFDARRWRHFRTVRMRARMAMAASLVPVVDFMRQAGPEAASENVDTYIDDDPVTDFYLWAYLFVGMPFGETTFERLTGDRVHPEELRRRISGYVQDNTPERIELVQRNTSRIVSNSIATGVAAGLTVPKIIESVGAAYRPARTSRIARSETIAASNVGSASGAKIVATVIPLQKMWLATPDDRTRETHADADGQTVSIAELFTVGGYSLDFPGDWSHGAPPEEIINCRCVAEFFR